MSRAGHRLLLLLSAPVLGVGLAACGSVVPAEQVATAAEDSIEEQVGVRTDVTCPDDLEAEVGAQTRCTLTVEGEPDEYGLTVTVTAVEDGDTEFDVVVDDQPLG